MSHAVSDADRRAIQIIQRDYGTVTPDHIVRAAEAPDHPWHDEFPWDDAVAARERRLEIARALMRQFKVRHVLSNGEIANVRQFLSVERPTGREYVPIEEVARNPVERALVLREARRAWRLFKDRYGALAEVMDEIRAEMDSAAS